MRAMLLALLCVTACAAPGDMPGAASQQATSSPPAEVAKRVLHYFANGCAARLGSSASIMAFARDERFIPARPEVAAMFHQGSDPIVLTLASLDLNVALVVERDGLQCRVYAQRTDVEVLRHDFVQLAEGIRRPGLLVKKINDREIGDGNQRARQIGYQLQQDGVSADFPARVLSLTTNTSPDARFTAIVAAAVARPE